MQALAALGGRYSHAQSINGQGQIVFKADPPMRISKTPSGNVAQPGLTHACLWRHGFAHDLGTLPNDSYSLASGVKIVLGYWHGTSYNPPEHAFLWRSGQASDMDSLVPANSGWILEEATGINDLGQICGSGKHNGKEQAFLLMPVSQ